MATDSLSKRMLNKVPEITIYFWIIKILCTTVGETAADFLNVNLNLGLTGTSIVMGILLVLALIFQFKTKKYTPSIYWIAVMFISVFGTLVTDNLTDKMGVPLELSTIIFSGFLAATFLIWYLYEKTLSIHSIFTVRRESFYWLAILFTFALGTAAGDLMAEGLGLGYAMTGIIIAGLIAIFAIGWRMKLNHVLSFWIIYILTRPLGASIGDYLSQPSNYGGLGFGATATSFIFIGGILGLVAYLSITKRDVIGSEYKQEVAEDEQKGGLSQTVIVIALLLVLASAGYQMRMSSLEGNAVDAQRSSNSASSVKGSPFGDLSTFRTITQDTLNLLNEGRQSDATARIRDLEYEWDIAEARLRPKGREKWKEIDDKIDSALRKLRAVNSDMESEKTALVALLKVLN